MPIIHGDVKTNNVLLGENLKAKLADFGLSKMYISDSQTHISVTAAGTVGYIDPEYVLLSIYYYIFVHFLSILMSNLLIV